MTASRPTSGRPPPGASAPGASKSGASTSGASTSGAATAGAATAEVGSGRKDEPSYEAARAELAEVMKALESGGQSLEDSLELWRRGEELAEICQRWLDQAGRRLDEAIAARSTDDGAPS